ncbi:hypothetical protein [Mitsuokella multacida]|uniref:hypothetical protein n=1 Tax=Mitsuokella multacida TaxID=52226 RepID=UPI003F641AD0
MKPYFSFQWHITDDCDQRCKHCYIFAESQQKCIDSMTRGEMETVLKNCEDFCETFGRRPYFYLTGEIPSCTRISGGCWKDSRKSRYPLPLWGIPFI